MKRNNLKEVLITLFKQNKKDKKIQEASDKLYNLLAPSSYTPILDSVVVYQLEAIKPLLDPDLYDWIEYFLFEAESFYPKCDIMYNYKEYTITSETDAIMFLLKQFTK
jgi:hypothetical protein